MNESQVQEFHQKRAAKKRKEIKENTQVESKKSKIEPSTKNPIFEEHSLIPKVTSNPLSNWFSPLLNFLPLGFLPNEAHQTPLKENNKDFNPVLQQHPISIHPPEVSKEKVPVFAPTS